MFQPENPEILQRRAPFCGNIVLIIS